MPKHAIDYSKTVIYKICCKDVSVKDLYVGSTTDVVKRRYNHKNSCLNEKDTNFNLAVYVFIRDYGGWLNWELVVVEAFSCKTSEEQRTRERFWLESLGATLNSYNPIRTREDVVFENKLWHKLQYQKNRENILEYQNHSRAANIEAIRERDRIYGAANRDTINKKKRKLITCECGAEVCHGDMARHKRTAKHIEAMQSI